MWWNIVVYSRSISSIQFHSIWPTCIELSACTSDRECSTRTSEASTSHKQKPGPVLVFVSVWTQPDTGRCSTPVMQPIRTAAQQYDMETNVMTDRQQVVSVTQSWTAGTGAVPTCRMWPVFQRDTWLPVSPACNHDPADKIPSDTWGSTTQTSYRRTAGPTAQRQRQNINHSLITLS